MFKMSFAVLSLSLALSPMTPQPVEASPFFEALASVERVDAMQGYIVLNGTTYRLAPTAKVYGEGGDGRYQLRAGQRVAFQIDTQATGETPIITDISIMNE